jgi:pimeloyl-ACP methyl ester carboxylesterase
MEDEQMPQGYLTMEDGVRLFFERAGNGGKHLLILNGLYLFEDFRYLATDRTVISLDLRNRGRSDYVADLSTMKRGVEQDVEDIEVVRRHFEIGKLDLLAHSYAGLIPILYAIKYPAHVRRVVQIGSMQPNQSTRYPAHLTNVDHVLSAFFANATKLETERQSLPPQEFCRKFWRLLRPIYVFNPDHEDKLLHWQCCDLQTELNLMAYWMHVLLPSVQRLNFTRDDLAKVSASVLVVHGTKDRSSPYGGGREWALLLPNARLLTIENVAHAPWIEAPEKVLGPVRTFLNGEWPEGAERVESL